MANQNSTNTDVTINATGFKIAGGSSTIRGITVAGSNDFTLTSQASTGNLTLPDHASTTLIGHSEYAAKGDLLTATAANTLSVLTVGTDGQILKADSAQANGLVWADSAPLPFTDVTGTTGNLAVNEAYQSSNAAPVTLTLPVTAAIGTIIEVNGNGAGGWVIAQNAGQSIHQSASTTTVGVGGSLASSNRYDAVRLKCSVADTEWVVVSAQGTLTVV